MDTEKDRLQKALEIFSGLKMEKEQKSLQNELSEVAEDNKGRGFIPFVKSLMRLKYRKK